MPQSREELIAIFDQCKDRIGDAIFIVIFSYCRRHRIRGEVYWKKFSRKLVKKFKWSEKDFLCIEKLDPKNTELDERGKKKLFLSIDITFEQLEQICAVIPSTPVWVLKFAVFFKESEGMSEEEFEKEWRGEKKYILWKNEQKENDNQDNS